MMDLIEKVARAIWLDHVDQQGYPNGLPTWDEMLVSRPADMKVIEAIRSEARAAVTAVFDWLGSNARDKLAYDTLPGEQFKALNQIECLLAHRHIMSTLRKEALGDES